MHNSMESHTKDMAGDTTTFNNCLPRFPGDSISSDKASSPSDIVDILSRADRAPRSPEVQAVIDHIQTLYSAGTPIFTKESLRRIGEELERCHRGERDKGGKFTMKGINGVEYETHVGPLFRHRPRKNQRHGGSTW
jgi:hypothetical protein